MPKLVARRAGATVFGKSAIRPPGGPPIARPTRQNASSEWSITGSNVMTIAATTEPATMIRFGRPTRSVSNPPRGTEIIVSKMAALTT